MRFPVSFPSPFQAYLVFSMVTGLIYFQSLGHEFVFDDSTYITQNPLIKNLNLSSIWALFTNFYEWDYLPLTLLSFTLEYQFFGLDPTGYHVVNTTLHIINVCLLHGILLKLSDSKPLAFWTALIFAVHPVHVESVVWISERKNVLSMIFLLLAFRSYLGTKFWPSILFFLAACLSKISVVIFPLLLVLHDHCFADRTFKANVIHKLPWFLVSLAIVVVALMTHTEGGTLRDDVGPWSTLLGMLVVFEEYLTKLFFPLNLNIWYPIPKYQSPLSGDVLAGILAVGAFIFLVRLIKKDKLIFFGLMWYVISLLPVSHIIPFPQMMADRFLYIPSIGLILAVVAGAQRIISNMGRIETGLASLLAVGVVLLFMSLNYHRSFVYENDFTLWEDSVKRHANNTVAVMYLGLTHWGKGDHDSALKYLQRAIEVNPKNIRAQVFMARILEEQKEFEQAIRIYENVIQQSPNTPSPYNHLAVLYGNQGKLGKAILLLEKAVGLDPEFGLAYFNLGVFQYQAGELENSLAAHQKAVEVEANNSQFHYQLGLFYLKNTDRGDLGRHHLEESLLLNPDRPDADKIRQMILKPS